MKPRLGKAFLLAGGQERGADVVCLESAPRDAARRRRIVRIGSEMRNRIGRSAATSKTTTRSLVLDTCKS